VKRTLFVDCRILVMKLAHVLAFPLAQHEPASGDQVVEKERRGRVTRNPNTTTGAGANSMCWLAARDPKRTATESSLPQGRIADTRSLLLTFEHQPIAGAGIRLSAAKLKRILPLVCSLPYCLWPTITALIPAKSPATG
jgi:hypothetical protein